MIGKYLEASTVNVTPSTMQRIEDSELGVTTMAGPYGAFIAVLDDKPLERKIVQESDLYPLFDKARSEGCNWVYLDKDADPLPDVPNYEDMWS